jgi:plastocyanin
VIRIHRPRLKLNLFSSKNAAGSSGTDNYNYLSECLTLRRLGTFSDFCAAHCSIGMPGMIDVPLAGA